MAETKYIDNNGLAHLWLLLKEKLAGKVNIENGKGLSTNDLTDELVSKINNASTFSGSYNDLTDTPTIPSSTSELTNDSGYITANALNGYAKKTEIPTNNNQLANGAGYQTQSDVATAIANAIADIEGISYLIVTELPEVGKVGIIYLISNGGSNPNIYDEYIYVNDKFEKIGTTDVDLSGYVKNTDLVAITNTEIDTILAN